MYAERGKDGEALTLYQGGLRIDPDNALFHSRIGILFRRQGRLSEAVTASQQAARLDPRNSVYLFNLGNALGDSNRFDEAVTAYRGAVQLRPGYAVAHYALGRMLAKQDRPDEAVAAYQKAVEADPNLPEAHCNLGGPLLRQGRYADALAAFRRGHELGSKRANWSYPSAEWVEQARRLVAMEPRMSALLTGTDTPTDPTDAAAVGHVAALQKRYARAAELYAAAIAADPANGRRFSGACAAARAGCGSGEDATKLDDAARTKWRKLALDWLRAELNERQKSSAGGSAAARRETVDRLRDWLSERDLAGVREVVELEKLPEAERAEWTQFWADVHTALGKDRKNPAKKE